MQKKQILRTAGFALILGISFGVMAKVTYLANGIIIEEKEEKPKEQIVKITKCGFDRPIRVATTVNNRPFGWSEWMGNKTTLIGKGYGVNMFREIAEELHLRFQVVGYNSDDEAISELKKGNLDLLIGVYTPDSTIGRNIVTVYPAIFSNVFAVYYRNDKAFDVDGFESLIDKKGVMRRSENIYPLFDTHLPEDVSISLETTEDAFKQLLSGEADYLIGSPYSVEAELRRYKLHRTIQNAPKAISQAALFMVLTSATDCWKLKDLLGKAIEKYVADPQKVDRNVRKIIDEWGERFREEPGMLEMSQKSENAESEPTTENIKN